MKNGQLNDRWPTALEEQANSERKEQFAEQVKQFGLGRGAIQNLEWNIVWVAKSITEAASRRTGQGDALSTGLSHRNPKLTMSHCSLD